MAKRSTPGESLLHAVDQTFQAAAGQAQTTRERAQDLVDDLSQTAGRLRGALDELRPTSGEDARSVRLQLLALERRMDELERRLSQALEHPAQSAPPRGGPSDRRAPGRRKAAEAAKTTRGARTAPAGKTAGGAQAGARPAAPARPTGPRSRSRGGS